MLRSKFQLNILNFKQWIQVITCGNFVLKMDNRILATKIIISKN